MTATPYPLPRENRESAILVGNGTVGPYGPSNYKIFDTADVKVFAKVLGATVYSDVTANCTIAKVNPANAYDYFTVTFNAAVLATTSWKHQARRTAERSVAVTKAGTLTAAELEKELSKQASAQSELRRDVDRAFSVQPGGTGGVIIPGADGELMQSDGAGNIEGSGENVATILGSTATAVAAAGTATTKAAEAGQSAINALAWAATPENTPVPGGGGLFSALHYAAKAAASAAMLASLIAGLTAFWSTVLQTASAAAAWVALQTTGYLTTRAALKALTPAVGMTVYVAEGARRGFFKWTLGNFSTQIAADTLEGFYIKATSVAATVGCWVREGSPQVLEVEWFDAAPNTVTDSQPAIMAANNLLVAVSGTTEGSIGTILATKGKYRLGASLAFSKPVAFICDNFLEYTPTTLSAVIVGAAAPTAGRNTGYDIQIGGLRAINGNTAAPTGINAAGCSGIEIRNMQFSTVRVGRIIAFTKNGFWGNQTNDVYVGQHCQDNHIWLGDVAYCGLGVMVESVSAANGAFQVNDVRVQNSFGNWQNFRAGAAGDNNTNNNFFLFNAMDADTGGGAGYVRGLYNDFQFGYASGTIAFEAGSAYNRCYAQVGKAQITFTDAGTKNDIVNAVEGHLTPEWWETTVTNAPPINLVSTDAGATYASLITTRRRSATAAPNDGGAGWDAYFWNDAQAEILGGRIRYDMPTVAAAGTNYNLRWLFDTIVGGALANRMVLWQGLIIGSPTNGDKGAGTLNTAGRIYQNDNATPYMLTGTATFDPASLADGAGATTTVAVTGAALGDAAVASFSLDTSGITITAWVSAANTVSVRFQNESGGVLDIASGTLKATVFK